MTRLRRHSPAARPLPQLNNLGPANTVIAVDENLVMIVFDSSRALGTEPRQTRRTHGWIDLHEIADAK